MTALFFAFFFIPHFFWVGCVAYHEMGISVGAALGIIAGFSIWHIMLALAHVRLLGARFFSLTLLFVWLSYATPFLPTMPGYPFFNPLLVPIALMNEVSGARCAQERWHAIVAAGKQVNIYPLVPPKSENRAACGQKMMLKVNKTGKSGLSGIDIIIAPESSLPFAISQEVEWLRSVLQKGSNIVFGATKKDEKNKEKSRQNAFLIDSSLIMHPHTKHHGIDFFEISSPKSKLFSFWRNIVGMKTGNFAAAQEQGAPWQIDGLVVQPLLCSEALWEPWSRGVDMELVLFNETWLPWPIQKLFIASLRWRSWWSGVPLLAVGHQSAWWFRQNK